jgi:hypothetical protein
MKALWVLAMLAVPLATAQQSWFLETTQPVTPASLYVHMQNDGTPLRGGNDSTTIGFMNVRPPLAESILVGGSLTSSDCAAPSGLPVSDRPNWVIGVSPDRIPLPEDQNYNHLHWNPTTMPFRLVDRVELTWYAGLAMVGPGGDLLTQPPPVQAILDAELVVAHTETGDGITTVIDQSVAAGSSEPVALGPEPFGSTETIEVGGFTAHAFHVRLNITDGEVLGRPDSSLRLHLRLRLADPSCGASNVALSQFWAFAATDPAEGLSVLHALTTDPIRIDEVEVHADRHGGMVRMLIHSPWGEADVDASFHGQIDDAPLDDLAQLQFKPSEHDDFHPLFNGNYTWTWNATANGPAIIDVIASNHDGSARWEAYLNFDVPGTGSVSCQMTPPGPAACTTAGVEAEAPAAQAMLAALLVVVAAWAARRSGT